VEAGLGGRHDATNVLRTRVVLLTNVGLEHTDVLGDTVDAIAREKLAVARAGAIVVLPDETFAYLVPGNEVRIGGAREAAEALVGHPIEADPDVSLPGRFELREGEVRDGAHNPDGVRYLVERLPPGDHAIVLSILRDKDADAMLRELRRVGQRWFVQTPNRGFPIEPHALLPFVHWLPQRLGRALWRIGGSGDPYDEVRLLDARELRRLFPDAVIVRERAGPLTKSLVAAGPRDRIAQ
jgi:hypothetical protein